MSTPNNRILWLDAVKGYGILMVLASHMLQVPQLGKELFSFYIPLFFIASGYTIKKGLTPKDFLFKKSKRLLLPYLIYGSLFTLFYICIRNFNFFELTNSDQTQPIIGLFYSRYCLFEYGTDPNVYFLPFEATSTLWFLTALFTGSAIYYLTTHFVRTNNYQNIILTLKNINKKRARLFSQKYRMLPSYKYLRPTKLPDHKNMQARRYET